MQRLPWHDRQRLHRHQGAGCISISQPGIPAKVIVGGVPAPKRSDALESAFGLDRDFRIGARGGAPHDTRLLVTLLVAGNLDVLRVNIGAEPRHLIGAERVGARDHSAVILDSHGYLRAGNSGAVRVPDESEIGGSGLRTRIVVSPEPGAARPSGD